VIPYNEEDAASLDMREAIDAIGIARDAKMEGRDVEALQILDEFWPRICRLMRHLATHRRDRSLLTIAGLLGADLHETLRAYAVQRKSWTVQAERYRNAAIAPLPPAPESR